MTWKSLRGDGILNFEQCSSFKEEPQAAEKLIRRAVLKMLE
jgi:hypothetical protein